MQLLDKLRRSKETYLIPITISLFLIPIFWNPLFINSFTQGKELLFKSTIFITILILFILFTQIRSLKFKDITKSHLFLLLLIQITIFSVSNALSDTALVTLHGSFTRGYGFITELFIFAFTIYCALIVSKNKINKLLKFIFVSGVIVGIYGILQKLGFDPFFKTYNTDIFNGRIFSFLGNPSYLGQYMLLTTIVGGHLISSEKTKKWIYLSGTIILISTLILSGTRTALLGLIAILILLAIRNYKKITKLKNTYKIILIVGILLSGVLISNLAPARYSLSNLALRSLNSRLEIWSGSLELIKEKPLLGYGGETFYIHFPEIVNKNFFTLEEDININADRLHNETLEVLYSHGIFATLIYLTILFYLIRLFFKSKNKYTTTLALLIIANYIQNQFAFPDITISIMMAFCFGTLVNLESKNDKVIIKPNRNKRILIAVVGIILSLYIANISIYKPYMSQVAYAKSRNNYSTNYKKAITEHKKAISYTPYYSQLWYELMLIDPSSMERALANLEQIEGNSGNVLAWKGNYHSKENLRKAIEYYTLALEKNPYHPNWIRAFADVLYKNKDYENALYMYNKYLESIPDFWLWRDDLNKLTPEQQKTYRIFMKNTPYFDEVIEKIEKINEKLK